MEALFIASAVTSALGAIQAGNARAAQYNAQQAAEDANADAFNESAVSARREGVAAETLQRRRAGAALDQQLSSTVQGGADPSKGSASVTFRQSMEDAELDALNIRYGAEQRARGFQTQASQARFQARVAGQNAGLARQSGYLSAAGSALQSISGYYRATKT